MSRKLTREEVAAKWLMWAADNRPALRVMAADKLAFIETVGQMLSELDPPKKARKPR